MYYEHEHVERVNHINAKPVWPRMSDGGADFYEMRAYFYSRHVNTYLAEANGWYPSRTAGDRQLRIVIPATTVLPDQIYWQARAVYKSAPIRYQSPFGARNGALVYVFACTNKEPTSAVVVTEGPFDALAIAYCGFDAIALMGITPGEQVLQHLLTLVNKRPALVVLDNEAEAEKASYGICLHLASVGSRARVGLLRHYKDAAECSPPVLTKFLCQELKEILDVPQA